MEIKINKEIRAYQETIFFGLSSRQFLCSLLAVGVGVGMYLLLKDTLSKEIVSWICIILAFPFAAMGFFKYNGLPFEKFLMALIKTVLGGRRRLYRSENYYYNILMMVAAQQKRQRKWRGKGTDDQNLKEQFDGGKVQYIQSAEISAKVHSNQKDL